MNVDFKPTKKMKKRRELDALVTHTKSTGHRRKKGQHELLVNDSESSELEEFSIPQKQALRKRGACRFCGTCVTVCGVFLLMACMAAIAGLVWVHIELKRELDQLQLKLDKVDESGRATPQEISAIKDKQIQLSKDLETWKDQIDSLQASVSNIINQISNLNKTTSSFSRSLAAASALEKIPDTVNTLAQSVADQGSSLHTTDEEIKALKTKVSQLETGMIEVLKEKDAGEATSKPSTSAPASPTSQPPSTAALLALEQHVDQEVKRLSEAVNSVNGTFLMTVGQMKANSEKHKSSLVELYNKTSELEERLSYVELPPPESSTGGLSAQQVNAIIAAALSNQTSTCSEAVDHLKNQTDGLYQQTEIKIQEISSNVSYAVKRLSSLEQTVKTVVINFGLERKPTTLQPPQETVQTGAAVGDSHHTEVSDSNQAYSTQANPATSSPFRTYEDLEEAFAVWDQDRDGLVEPADMGAAGQGIDLYTWDEDKDNMLSLSELQKAFSIPTQTEEFREDLNPVEETHPSHKRSLTDQDVQDLLGDIQGN